MPKFDYPEGHNEYFKPLVPAKKPSNKRKKPEVFRQYLQTNGLHQYIEDDDQVGSSSTGMLQQFRRTLEEPIPLVFKEPIVDPSLRNTKLMQIEVASPHNDHSHHNHHNHHSHHRNHNFILSDQCSNRNNSYTNRSQHTRNKIRITTKRSK